MTRENQSSIYLKRASKQSSNEKVRKIGTVKTVISKKSLLKCNIHSCQKTHSHKGQLDVTHVAIQRQNVNRKLKSPIAIRMIKSSDRQKTYQNVSRRNTKTKRKKGGVIMDFHRIHAWIIAWNSGSQIMTLPLASKNLQTTAPQQNNMCEQMEREKES